MYKQFLYSTLAITLSACGGGSSSDASSTNSTTTGTVSASESGGTTGAVTTNETGGTTGGVAVESGGASGSTDTGGGSSVTQYGLINLDVIGDFVDMNASFASLSQPLPFSAVLEANRPGIDTCEVSRIDIADVLNITDLTGLTDFTNTIAGIDQILENITSISAGEVLTISSSAGSYAELLRVEQSGFTLYDLDEGIELSIPVPSNLSLNIPGDEFPAFTNIALSDVEPLLVSSPGQTDEITASTNFSWNGSTNPDSFVEINITAIAADFTSSVTVKCEVVDDGSFTFASATQAALGDFVGMGSQRFDRMAVKIVQQGSSIVLLTTRTPRVL